MDEATFPQPAARVRITRFVDGAFPGVVECELEDEAGRSWIFVEKVPIVTAEALDASSPYPRPGLLACSVLDRWRRPDGAEVVRIDTARPWGISATSGETLFVIRSELVTGLDRE